MEIQVPISRLCRGSIPAAKAKAKAVPKKRLGWVCEATISIEPAYFLEPYGGVSKLGDHQNQNYQSLMFGKESYG